MLVISNHHIGSEVHFHDVFHGFLLVRGTEITSLESKMIHKLAEMRGEVFYEVFLYL